MGKPIVYCGQCGKSLPEDDFKRGRASVIEHQPYCADCRPAEAPDPEPSAPKRKSSTQRIPVSPPRPVRHAPPPSSSRLLVPIGIGFAVIIVIVIAVMASGGPSEAPPRPSSGTPAPVRAAPPPPPSTPGPAPSPPGPPRPATPPKAAADLEREMKADLAKAEAEKFDRFLSQIRESIARGWLTPQTRKETGDMIETALKQAGARRAEVEKLREEYERKAVLVGYWKLDEESGSIAADASGNGHDGELSSGVLRVPGRIGGALSFDGVKEGVTLRSTEGMSPQVETGEMTLSLWVKVAVMPDEMGQKRRPIAAKGDLRAWEYALYLNSSGKFEFLVWLLDGTNHATAAGGTAEPNRWHHLAGVYEKGKSIRLYVDGREAARSTAFTGTPEAGGASFFLGRRGDGQFFAGAVDEVRLYRRALADEEIRALSEAK